MQVLAITAHTVPADGDDAPSAEVTVHLDGDREFIVGIYQSTRFPNAIIVQVDGDLTGDDPALRLYLNDDLIVDTGQREPESMRDPH
jgi:hypothetical protein